MVSIAAPAVPKFLSSIPGGITGFLFYGSDALQITARAETLARQLAAHTKPAAELVRLHADDIASAPEKLETELTMQPLFGGAKVIWLSGLPLKAQSLLSTAASLIEDNAKIVVEAPDLKKSHKIVSLFETAKHLAALACYGEDEASSSELIRVYVASHGFGIAPEAAKLIAARTDFCALIARRECEKLMLLLGEPCRIEVGDVEQALVDHETAETFEVAEAALNGDARETASRFDKFMAIDPNVTAVLLAFNAAVLRLHRLCSFMEGGMPALQAVKELKPPVFFKQQDALLKQARLWSLPKLEEVTRAFNITLKQTRLKPQIASEITLHFLLKASRMARK